MSKDISKVDFFAYTFKGLNFTGSDGEIYDELMHILPYLLPDPVLQYIIDNHCECSIMGVRGMGYSFRLCFENIGISIMTNGATEQHGTHIVLSGTILRLCNMDRESFRLFNDNIDFRISRICDIIVSDSSGCVLDELSFNVSRIDIAYDFSLPFNEFYERLEDGCFSYSAKKIDKHLNENNQGTIYIGGRQSPCFIRIYDKSLEIKEKNMKMLGIVPDDVPVDFTRVEFEFKNHSSYKNANNAFCYFLDSDKCIGNFCLNFLKIHNFDIDEYGGIIVYSDMWNVFETVILSNYGYEEFVVEYDKSSDISINLTYLQIVANLIVTYCRRIPGLLSYLTKNLSPSKSALRKTSNVNIDFSQIYDNALEIVNEQELIILEHLTFFDQECSSDSD